MMHRVKWPLGFALSRLLAQPCFNLRQAEHDTPPSLVVVISFSELSSAHEIANGLLGIRYSPCELLHGQVHFSWSWCERRSQAWPERLRLGERRGELFERHLKVDKY